MDVCCLRVFVVVCKSVVVYVFVYPVRFCMSEYVYICVGYIHVYLYINVCLCMYVVTCVPLIHAHTCAVSVCAHACVYSNFPPPTKLSLVGCFINFVDLCLS